jgi:hypothetical protein
VWHTAQALVDGQQLAEQDSTAALSKRSASASSQSRTLHSPRLCLEHMNIGTAHRLEMYLKIMRMKEHR